VLITGLEVSRSITVDDSGARHKGRNGYVTQIGNAWFASTASKSRINFLELLHAGNLCYNLNDHTLDYLIEQGLPQTDIPSQFSPKAPPSLKRVGFPSLNVGM
jgi:hypothetical protein